MRKFLNWLFGAIKEDRTLGHQLHWVTRGVNDVMLHDIQPMDEAWLNRHR